MADEGHTAASTVPGSRVTELLQAWSGGDRQALDRLTAIVYSELQQVARAQLRHERDDHTLETGGLVHEAFLRLVDQSRVQWRGRAQFFAIAARMMRRVLVDHARRRKATRRGAGVRITLVEPEARSQGMTEDLLALDLALDQLAELDLRQAQIVELRYFAGMTVSEAAAALDISPATLKREWTVARAWLRRALAEEPQP